MADQKVHLTSENATVPLVRRILDIYPSVLEVFYQDKLKGDKKKISQAQEDDHWRYEALPVKIQQRDEDEGLSKDELERLVRWKITHQTNRPFLLPQIRKNDPKDVEACTMAARKILLSSRPSSETEGSSAPSIDQVRKALDKVCELRGVGPATGTLLLSIFDPMNVPFFEDELYAWLYPDAKDKLKYNVKEYFELFSRFRKGLTTDRKKESKSLKFAEAYEKVAFVLGHWDCVEDTEKTAIEQMVMSNETKDGDVSNEKNHTSSPGESQVGETLATPKEPAPNKPAKRGKSEDKGHVSGARRSKRFKT